MRGWTALRISFVVVVALLVIIGTVAFVVAGDDGGYINFWETDISVGPEQPLGLVLVSNSEPKGAGAVNSYRTKLRERSPQQLGPLRAFSWRRRVVVSITGGNAMDRSVIRGTLSCSWRYDGHQRMSDPRCNTWGDGDSHWGWSYRGVTSSSTGGGWTTNCGDGYCQYRYRRPYLKWRRGYQDISQTVTGFISLTMRADGSCVADKFREPGTIGCDSGGSW